jgi:hypothetical protein
LNVIALCAGFCRGNQDDAAKAKRSREFHHLLHAVVMIETKPRNGDDPARPLGSFRPAYISAPMQYCADKRKSFRKILRETPRPTTHFGTTKDTNCMVPLPTRGLDAALAYIVVLLKILQSIVTASEPTAKVVLMMCQLVKRLDTGWNLRIAPCALS